MAIQDARHRAEDFVNNVQTRAREAWESKSGWTQSVRTLLNEKQLTPADARRRVNKALGGLKTRGARFERRAQVSIQRLAARLPVASRAEVDKLGKQVMTLNRKVGELTKKLTNSAVD